jgi:hypothetical protein
MNRTTRTALAAAAALLALAAPAGATTAPLPGTTFQAGDGDQEATDGLRDWATVAPSPGATTADPSAAGPDSFSLGSKEQAPGDWALVGREPSNKFDFLAAWARPESGSHEHLYLAFRRDSPNGNTYLTFELNQVTRRWDNDGHAASPAVPCRTDGDVLISYEVEPGGNAEPDPVTVRLYRWHTATRDAATGCSRTGTMTGGAVLNSPFTVNPLAQGAINDDGPIANHLDTDGDGRADTPVFGRGTFAEAGLDVSAATAALGLDCAAFGQVGLHSRASVSISSALKDYVAPVPLDVDTCREPEPPGEEPPPATPPASSPPPARPPAGPGPRPEPPAQVQVLGRTQRPARGRARLQGPSGCVPRPFTATVRGRQLRRATFFLDGRRVATRSARRGQRRLSVRIRPGRLGYGVHRLTARVVFRTASRTRPRTLILSFQRCARRAPAPRFTG